MGIIERLPENQRFLVVLLIAVLSVMVAALLATSFVLLRSLRKLKARNEEVSNFNELRQTFIDADNSIVFLKDEKLRYVFVNKAFRELHKLDDDRIIGYDDSDILEDKSFAESRRKSDLDVLKNRMTTIDEFSWLNRVFLSTKFPVKLSGGKYGVGGYIKEVTDEYNNIKRLEEANAALKEKEEKLKELLNSVTDASYRDSLTGLYNRRFFDEELKRLDVERNLPVSVIVGDVNYLKLTNDIFGHTAGDMLLQKAAEIMKKACRADDIISRWGGDEFGLLLPKTKNEDAEEIARRIKNLFSKENIRSISCSISLGVGTKQEPSENIQQTIDHAEDRMYTIKTLEQRQNSGNTVRLILQNFYDNYPGEEQHSKNVSQICLDIGMAMHLNESEMKSLKEAGLFHDIGKIVLDKGINKRESLTENESDKMKLHPIVGYRILNSSDQTVVLAKYVLSHHERWDGTGYPRGLKENAIPKLSRIIAIAESYDAMTNDSFYKKAISREQAILEIKKNAGTQFDPEIVRIFTALNNEKSGL